MPTGYTSDLYEGEQTFHDFALNCARAFGALISMRDAAPGTPIPDEFPADTDWHDDQIALTLAKLTDLDAITADEAATRIVAEREQCEQHRAEMVAERDARQARYQRMLAEVEVWQPPTMDHVELKHFMAEQLARSMEFDNWVPDPPGPAPTPGEWIAEQRRKAERDLAYLQAERAKAIQRAEERTAWVKALRASLEAQEAAR